MAASKKNTDRSRQKTVSFRLPFALMEELRSLAKLNRRTLSGEVQLALEKHLETFNGSENSDDPLRKGVNKKAKRPDES